MPRLTSSIDPNSAAFKGLDAHNRALNAELRAKVAKAGRGGTDASRDRHVARGKWLPRDRVERLLDPGSPFLEVGQLAANGMYGDAPGKEGGDPDGAPGATATWSGRWISSAASRSGCASRGLRR